MFNLHLERRMRRYRQNQAVRQLVQETRLHKTDYIYPIFVVEGENVKNPVSSMPGVYQFSIDRLSEELDRCQEVGITCVMFFGIPNEKDSVGSGASAHDGIIQKALRFTKENYPKLLLSTDVCMCEYTSHGHCGIIKNNYVNNDATLDRLVEIAVSHAEAGATILAPSDMMDGRVRAIRQGLDDAGYENVMIMAHAVKYASAFYGPFREAAESTPKFGDRRTYQMDSASSRRQAMEELLLDSGEGADFLIVKPGLAYLDLIAMARENFTEPIVAYNVSGEYAMVKAAAAQHWIDERAIVMEMMTGFKRAGADIVITYHALDLAKWIDEEELRGF